MLLALISELKLYTIDCSVPPPSLTLDGCARGSVCGVSYVRTRHVFRKSGRGEGIGSGLEERERGTSIVGWAVSEVRYRR